MIRNEAKTFKTHLGAKLPVPPRFADLPHDLRIRLASCQFAILRIDTHNTALLALCGDVQALRDAPAAKPLSHRLSDAFVEKQISEGRDIVEVMQSELHDAKRLSMEVFASDAAQLAISDFVYRRKSEAFSVLLEKMCTNVIGTPTVIRTSGVQLGADASGARWVFPAPRAIRPLMNRLANEVLEAFSQSPLFAAVIALVGVNAIHPFTDGNGRTSRALFNSLLRSGGLLPSKSYIPLKHIYFIAKFGFEIRLREAILLNNYLPILNFFCDAMDLTGELCTPSGRSSMPDALRNEFSEEMSWATNG
jgi:hypothetical protein